jgi:hypothetical protein
MHGIMFYCCFFLAASSAAVVECCETEGESSGRRVGVKGSEGERQSTELPFWASGGGPQLLSQEPHRPAGASRHPPSSTWSHHDLPSLPVMDMRNMRLWC